MTRNNNFSIIHFTGRGFFYSGLVVLALIFAFPFYYVFVLSSWSDIYAVPPHMWFGSDFFINLHDLFVQIPFHVAFLNSLGIAIIATALTIFFCTMGGFAFAKYDFKGKKSLMLFVLLTLAIPQFLNIIPFFKMMKFIGWYQTWLPLIIPGMANSFGIFLMTQFLERSVPQDLLDAGRIDGLNEFQLLLHVVFPLAKPGIAVLGTVTFIGSWNNFLQALTMLPDAKNSTLPVALSAIFVRSDGNFGGMMVGIALSLLPLILAFSFFSQRIIANLTAGSVKG